VRSPSARLPTGQCKAITQNALLVAAHAHVLDNDIAFIVATLEGFRRAGLLTNKAPPDERGHTSQLNRHLRQQAPMRGFSASC
jgi:hypothetical protein